jgi:hypothetical protein
VTYGLRLPQVECRKKDSPTPESPEFSQEDTEVAELYVGAQTRLRLPTRSQWPQKSSKGAASHKH